MQFFSLNIQTFLINTDLQQIYWVQYNHDHKTVETQQKLQILWMATNYLLLENLFLMENMET